MAKILTISRQQLLDQLSPSEIRKYYNSLDQDIFSRNYYHNDKKDHCKNGEHIEIGTHGPETKNGNTYISIYHHLEYIKVEPSSYDTERLGLYLTNKSLSDYLICKYKSQNFKINKFNVTILEKERINFNNYLTK